VPPGLNRIQPDAFPLRDQPNHQDHANRRDGDPDRPKQGDAFPPNYFERMQKMMEMMEHQDELLSTVVE
jgi:hypothetical protein